MSDSPSSTQRKHARILALGLRGGLWTESTWKHRIGMVLVYAGHCALVFILFAPLQMRWLWSSMALLVIAIGLVLLFVGAKFFPQEHGPD